MALDLLFLLAAAAQQAAPQPSQAPIVVTGQLPDDQKKVCRPVEEEIGSIIPKKVCRTKGQWAEIKKMNERRTRAYVDDKNGMSGRSLFAKEGSQ